MLVDGFHVLLYDVPAPAQCCSVFFVVLCAWHVVRKFSSVMCDFLLQRICYLHAGTMALENVLYSSCHNRSCFVGDGGRKRCINAKTTSSSLVLLKLLPLAVVLIMLSGWMLILQWEAAAPAARLAVLV